MAIDGNANLSAQFAPQMGGMHMTPPPLPSPERGASFGKQVFPTRVQALGSFNYGLQNRLTQWQAPLGAALGQSNLGSTINFNGPAQYAPVEVR